MNATKGEYVEAHFIGHEIIWGEGYMSPGGDAEGASVVDGRAIAGRTVLDIGCGLGGPAVALVANHGAGTVVGIDIQSEQIERSRQLADRRDVAGHIDFLLVDPGPLPFENTSFDVTFSMGAFVQIPDKYAMYAEIFRVLRPGGMLAANDWVREWDGPLSVEMVTHHEKAGLTYNWVTSQQTQEALGRAGFIDIMLTDRGQWQLAHFRADITRLETGSIRERLIEIFDQQAADNWLSGWRRMALMADRGEIGAVQIRATKPT